MKKYLTGVVILTLIGTLSLTATGCRTKGTKKKSSKKIELTYYRLFDNEDIFQPMIQEFESKNKNIKIHYRKFTDPQEYEDLIINELAEGEGPDIFSLHNTWMLKHRKKLTPAPEKTMNLETFEKTFVQVAAQDMLLRDEGGNVRVYGIPLSVDTLALYYNKDIYEDRIPSRGKPATTWEALKEDVYKLNKKDNSFERFEVAGIAMGRADNIIRAVDILYLLMLQEKTKIYNENFTEATFARSQGGLTEGSLRYPGVEALTLFTSFGIPSNKNYSWNMYLSDPQSKEKEIETFARGKVAMVIGYSYLYEEIVNQMDALKKKGLKSIDKQDIGVVPIPQVFDPENSDEGRETYASYFAESVTRTSEHPQEAWEFIRFLSSKENEAYLYEKTGRPTSRRDLIEEQIKDPIYGVFVSQLGYAKSIAMADPKKYKEILEKTIEAVLNNQSASEALRIASSEIDKLIPKGGLFPQTETE